MNAHIDIDRDYCLSRWMFRHTIHLMHVINKQTQWLTPLILPIECVTQQNVKCHWNCAAWFCLTAIIILIANVWIFFSFNCFLLKQYAQYPNFIKFQKYCLHGICSYCTAIIIIQIQWNQIYTMHSVLKLSFFLFDSVIKWFIENAKFVVGLRPGWLMNL